MEEQKVDDKEWFSRCWFLRLKHLGQTHDKRNVAEKTNEHLWFNFVIILEFCLEKLSNNFHVLP